MDARVVLQVVLYVFLIVLSGIGVWAMVELIATARSTRRLTDELGEILPPLIRSADGTLAAVNAEIERVDGVVSQFEEVSENVVATTKAASDIAGAPAAAVAGIADKTRTFFSILLGRRV
jgi:ABC-type transporter Mla subunit MlaD